MGEAPRNFRVDDFVRRKRRSRSFGSAQDDRVWFWERAKSECRSFDSAEVRFAQDDRSLVGRERKGDARDEAQNCCYVRGPRCGYILRWFGGMQTLDAVGGLVE